MVDMDPGIEHYMFDQLHQLLFDILLATDGRTTDILETLLDEKMKVEVIRQQQIDGTALGNAAGLSGGPYYVRESLLISDQSRFIVSHNISLVCSQDVPPAMFEALAAQQEGIGKTINDLGLQTSRRLSDCGWITAAETVDLFGMPIELRFTSAQSTERTPYKRYAIYFGDKAGIHLLEYFNPDIVRHRLLRGGGW